LENLTAIHSFMEEHGEWYRSNEVKI